MNTAYELVAMGMRYIFAVLIVYLLFRIVVRSIREYRTVRRIKRNLEPVYAGYITISLPEDFEGESFPLSCETTIGSTRRCDICFEDCGLEPIHAVIYEKKGEVYISGYGRKDGIWLNGEKIGKKPELLFNGDLIEMGELALILHLPGEEDECEEA